MKQFIKAISMLILAAALSLNTALIVFADEGSVTVNGYIEVPTVRCSVTYVANGGTGDNYTDSGIVPGEPYEIVSCDTAGFSRSGYKFTGWNTGSIGGGAVYAPGDTITLNKDITLYAQWEKESTGESTAGGAPSNTVKTGDTGNMPLWSGILFASLSMMLFMLWLCQRRELRESKDTRNPLRYLLVISQQLRCYLRRGLNPYSNK